MSSVNCVSLVIKKVDPPNFAEMQPKNGCSSLFVQPPRSFLVRCWKRVLLFVLCLDLSCGSAGGAQEVFGYRVQVEEILLLFQGRGRERGNQKLVALTEVSRGRFCHVAVHESFSSDREPSVRCSQAPLRLCLAVQDAEAVSSGTLSS